MVTNDDDQTPGKNSTRKVTLGLNITAAMAVFDLNMIWSGRFGGYHYLNSKGANGSMITNVGDALPGDAWNKILFLRFRSISAAGIIKDENGTIIGSSYDPCYRSQCQYLNEYPRCLLQADSVNTFPFVWTSFSNFGVQTIIPA